MQAPDWVRNFCRWRWTPCFTLISSSLAFVAIVLLIIPAERVVTARSVAALPTLDMTRPAPPPRVTFQAPAAREAMPAPDDTSGLPTVTVAPGPAAALTPTTAILTEPNFAANIADRNDRPPAPGRPELDGAADRKLE